MAARFPESRGEAQQAVLDVWRPCLHTDDGPTRERELPSSQPDDVTQLPRIHQAEKGQGGGGERRQPREDHKTGQELPLALQNLSVSRARQTRVAECPVVPFPHVLRQPSAAFSSRFLSQ